MSCTLKKNRFFVEIVGDANLQIFKSKFIDWVKIILHDSHNIILQLRV